MRTHYSLNYHSTEVISIWANRIEIEQKDGKLTGVWFYDADDRLVVGCVIPYNLKTIEQHDCNMNTYKILWQNS